MELQVETGVNRNISPNFALVDMGAFKVSTARPLYTYGAGPCMNVVVHNETSDVGGLAHIAYGGMTAEVDINEKTRFDKANMVIQTMVNQTGSSNPGTTVDKVTGGTEIGLLKPEKPSLLGSLSLTVLQLFNNTQSVNGASVALWLGAGGKFVDTEVDFVNYITKLLGPLGVKLRVMDERKTKGSGDVVYDPFNARVYKLADGDLEFIRFSEKNATTIQQQRRQRLEQALSQYFA